MHQFSPHLVFHHRSKTTLCHRHSMYPINPSITRLKMPALSLVHMTTMFTACVSQQGSYNGGTGCHLQLMLHHSSLGIIDSPIKDCPRTITHALKNLLKVTVQCIRVCSIWGPRKQQIMDSCPRKYHPIFPLYPMAAWLVCLWLFAPLRGQS